MAKERRQNGIHYENDKDWTKFRCELQQFYNLQKNCNDITVLYYKYTLLFCWHLIFNGMKVNFVGILVVFIFWVLILFVYGDNNDMSFDVKWYYIYYYNNQYNMQIVSV